jgi:hypothetical protein
MLLPPPLLVMAAPKPPPPAMPPAHPKARTFTHVGSVTILAKGHPVVHTQVYLDPAALRTALNAKDLRGLPVAEAVWRVYLEGRIPMAWRYENLTELGGTFRRGELERDYRARWVGDRAEIEAPEVQRFFASLNQPRNLGDWSETIFDGPFLRVQDNGGPWQAYRSRGLVVTYAVVSGHLAEPFPTDLRALLVKAASL